MPPITDGVFNPLDSRIEVSTFLEDLNFVPTLCLQCEKAYCVEVCPTSALTKNDQTGVVDFNKDKCIGCKQCIIACPWGSIKLNCVGKEIIKCDNCDGDPACVKVCSAKALTFEDAKQKGTAARLKEIGKDLAKGVSSL